MYDYAMVMHGCCMVAILNHDNIEAQSLAI